MSRLPTFTFSFAGLALLIGFLPSAQDWLAYDREAILQGEVWRLLTGHLVHLSVSHLAWNLVALLLLGGLLESRTGASRPAMFVGMPVTISAGLLLLEPTMHRYGGLSGLTTAMLIYNLVTLCNQGTAARLLGLLMLTALVFKTVCESLQTQPLFTSVMEPGVVVSTTSHLLGAGLALLVFALRTHIQPQRAPLIHAATTAK